MASTNTNQVNLLEKSITSSIMAIAQTGASVAARANLFQSNGSTKFIADMGNSAATIVAEMASVSTSDINLKEVNFRQKRMASAIEVTRDAADNAAVSLPAHVSSLLANRVMLGIEAQMFNTGDKDGATGLQNIVLHNTSTTAKLEDIGVKTAASATVVTYQELMDTVAILTKQPENVEGAIWVVEDIAKFSAVKDTANRNVLTFDALPAGAIGRVLGIPVYKTPAFTAGQKVAAILMNPAKAYGVSVAQSADVQQIKGDTIQELKQSSVFLGEVYVDGKVINPRAIAMLKFL
jgi:HK97 family phage major capsid protein